jgi:hypothetical protein
MVLQMPEPMASASSKAPRSAAVRESSAASISALERPQHPIPAAADEKDFVPRLLPATNTDCTCLFDDRRLRCDDSP